MRRIIPAAAIGCLLVTGAFAADGAPSPISIQKAGACKGCGSLKGDCKGVWEMKEVKKTVWEVQCEEFCVPMPSLFELWTGGDKCDTPCKGGVQKSCGEGCDVSPRCGKVRCRKKLVKKEVNCKVPVYKCVPAAACGKKAVQIPAPYLRESDRTQEAQEEVPPAPEE